MSTMLGAALGLVVTQAFTTPEQQLAGAGAPRSRWVCSLRR